MKLLILVIILFIIFWWVYDDAVAKVFLAEVDDESFYLWYAYQVYYASNETVTIFEPDGDITVCTVSEDNVIVCILATE